MQATARLVVPRAVGRSTSRAQLLRQRHQRILRVPRRGYATDSSAASGGSSSGLIGGLVGGLAVFLSGYGYYHFSGAKTLVNTAQSTKSSIEAAIQRTKDAAPEPSQALKWLRETSLSYAALIPGASSYVNRVFDDLDKVQEKHAEEVDKIVKDTYSELKDASKDGVSTQSVTNAWEVLTKAMSRIAALAGDAVEDVLDNHPELKEKVGANLDDLKNMGKKYGPEAQKKVDETWNQVQDILKGGIGVGTIEKIRQLIQERSEDLKKFSDQAWEKGMEQVKPLLEKKPELKKLVEENKDKLLKGDLGELWKKVQDAAKSGDLKDLQDYVKDQAGKAGKKAKDAADAAGGEGGGFGGGGVEGLLGLIPGGKEILPKFQQLSELAEKHGKEAEKLVKEAVDDIKKVLEEKVNKGKKIVDEAEGDAKEELKDDEKSNDKEKADSSKEKEKGKGDSGKKKK